MSTSLSKHGLPVVTVILMFVAHILLVLATFGNISPLKLTSYLFVVSLPKFAIPRVFVGRFMFTYQTIAISANFNEVPCYLKSNLAKELGHRHEFTAHRVKSQLIPEYSLNSQRP